jgi:DNA-binding MarR family transcriptional regulator
MRFFNEQVRRQRTPRLSLPQIRTLAFLSRTDQASLSAVAGYLGFSLPTMSRAMEGMVANGWVDRRPVANNRRQVALTLTARGAAMLEQARGGIRTELATLVGGLPPAERAAVTSAMHSLRRVFDLPGAAKPAAHQGDC